MVAEQSKSYRYSTNHQVVIDADPRLVVAGRPVTGNRNDSNAWELSDGKAAVGRTTVIADGGYRGTGPGGKILRDCRLQGDGSPPRPLGGCSVEAELVALDVLHHDARLIVVIGKQQSHAYRAERDQPCALGLERGEALFTHEPGADPHVKMQPILDDLAFGNALEVQPRAHA